MTRPSSTLALLAAFLLLGVFHSAAQANNFVWTQTSISGYDGWYGVCVSVDGTRMAAAPSTSYIRTSNDGGSTWISRTSSGYRAWRGIVSSSDGIKLAAHVYNGYIYTSADTGVTWTERTGAGSREWKGITSSADGLKLAVAPSSGYIYTSTDAGATWTEQTASGSRSWGAIASSADGLKLAAAVRYGYVYTSADGGATWTEQTGSGSLNWAEMTMSGGGDTLLAGVSNGKLMRSVDGGVTWTEYAGFGNKYWEGVAISSDGTICGAVNQTYEYIHSSLDGGTTWDDETSGPSTSWYSAAMSADGTTMILGRYGNIYVGVRSLTAPTVTTATPTMIMASSATCGGNVTNTGGYAVTARGVCWSTSPNPTTANDTTLVTPGSGSFTSAITGLSGGTTYHVRAYAVNSEGTAYGNDVEFTTVANPDLAWFPHQPTGGTSNWGFVTSSADGTRLLAGSYSVELWLSTNSGASWTAQSPGGYTQGQWNCGASSADGMVLIAGVFAKRLYYSTDGGSNWAETQPVGDADGYWTCAAMSEDGSKIVVGYDNGRLWVSTDSAATWSETRPAGDSNQRWQKLAMSADGSKIFAGIYGGTLYRSSNGGASWSSTPSPAGYDYWYALACSPDGNTVVAGPNGGRLVISKDAGASWSERMPAGDRDRSWHLATVSGDGSRILVGATSGAAPPGGRLYLSRDGGDTWAETRPNGDTDMGWACAANSWSGRKVIAAPWYGSVYTGVASIPAEVPTVSTNSITDILSSTATGGGLVLSDNGATVTARGVCWSTSVNPTTADDTTMNGSGLGGFTSALTGLSPNTTYHVRAYATNSAGTSYGSDVEFSTTALPPAVTTASVTNITDTTASCGGEVTNDNGAAVTARGVCWSTSENPTTADDTTFDGTGTGAFTSAITGLSSNTTYHVRAYATNAGGTSYGDDVEFSTYTTPTVTTASVTDIGTNTASSGGEVTDDGGASVTARGVCWGTSEDPSVADDTTFDGTGTGAFTSAVTGLAPGITYHLRAYAINAAGTSYGSDLEFTTDSTTATVTTATLSDITDTTASGGGEVTADGGAPVTARGVCWSTSENPTVADDTTFDGTGTGAFTSGITGLSSGVTYHARAYATNAMGTSYGEDRVFMTDRPPTVMSSGVSDITDTTASCGGTVTSDGGAPVTARGVCWSTSENPTVADDTTFDGTGGGAFTSAITGLTSGVTYHVRAYATNAVGTNYGNDIPFTTDTPPTVTTASVTEVTDTTASCGGNVTSDGGDPVTARGVCWSTSENPTVADDTTFDGTGAGAFTSAITGLISGTTYHVRAYAINAVGTSYGDDVEFTTHRSPIVVTWTVTVIDTASVSCNGEVIMDGGAAVTARGICWGTSENPSIADDTTWNGSGVGTYTGVITGLSPGTTYHARAYGTNTVGTGYGVDREFTTDSTTATVTTAAVTDVGTSTASCGGEVTADGGAPVTARGVCWNTSENPTVADDTTMNGTGTGAFASAITGLSPGTTYHVRAYAINAKGTAYGADTEFTTDSTMATVTTDPVTGITSTTADCGGEVTADGGAPVTARGVCWSTSPTPTVANDTTWDGAGTGTFTSALTGLTEGTTYYLRAYATNVKGTTYGSEVWFSTAGEYGTPLALENFDEDIVANGSGSDQAEATTTTSLGCEVLYAESFSGNYGTGPDGVPDDRVVVSEADPDLRYHLEPYDGNNAIILAEDAESRSLDLSDPTSLRAISVLAFGVFGNASVTARVLFTDASYQDFELTILDWYGGANPAITYMGRVNRAQDPPECEEDWDEFDVLRDFRMYDYVLNLDEENRSKTVSGVQFTKNGGETAAVIMAMCAVEAPSTQASSVVFRDVCAEATVEWTRGDGDSCAVFLKPGDTGSAAPVDAATYTANAAFGSGSQIGTSGWYCVYNGTGTEVTVTGLSPGTTYRAMVCEFNGGEGSERYLSDTASGNPANVAMPDTPTVTTAAVTDTAFTSASSGGEVTADGGATVSARGVCWSTSENPTVADDTTMNGTGTGAFASAITGLDPETTYHVRAYATNCAGTSYGNDLQFTTTPTPPTVTTASAVLSGTTAFDAGGEVTDAGGATVTARGICWNTTGDPTIADDHTTDGSGTGVFSSSATGLGEATHFFFRAYATNTGGTSYGEQRTIITGSSAVADGYAWTERRPGGDVDLDWRCVANSADGTVRAAGVRIGRLYTSYDSGTSWTERRPAGDVNGIWSALDVSWDGAHMVAAPWLGYVYTSDDSGVTWTEHQVGGETKDWNRGAISSDGTTILMGAYTDSLYISWDAGASWTSRLPGTDLSPQWKGIAVSSDGMKMIAAAWSGRVFTSWNSGDTWTERRPAGDVSKGWQCAAVSSDGRVMYVSEQEGSIYASSDSGVTWSEVTPAGVTGENWTSLATSADGTQVLAGIWVGDVYVSPNSGTSWNRTLPAGPGDEYWMALDVTADGTLPTAAAYFGGRLYTGTSIELPSVTTAEVTGIDTTGASSGGEVTDDGGSSVIARGVCWSTSENPTVADDTTWNGSGSGAFTSEITGLTPYTTYHVRAYATNGAGTAYGDDIEFATDARPTLVLTQMPSANALDVSGAANIAVTFSAGIDTSTVNENTFLVHGSMSGTVAGTFAKGDSSITFDPTLVFKTGEIVTVALTTGIEDQYGNSVVGPVIWRFTAEAPVGDAAFPNAVSFGPTNDYTRELLFGDVDGDGDLDIASAVSVGQSKVYKNDGAGTSFTTVNFGPSGYDTRTLALGDVDGDGDLDIAVGNTSYRNFVYKNDGTGSTWTPVTISMTGDNTFSVAMGDVDGDGDLDIAVGNYSQQNVVYKNDGTGTSFTPVYFGTGSDATQSIAFGDVDNDGDLDLVVANFSQQCRVYKNDGTGTTWTGVNFGPASAPVYWVDAGDVDADGDVDILLTSGSGQSVVYFNNGTGTTWTGVNCGPALLFGLVGRFGDLDGDGDLDVVFSTTDGQDMALTNDGTGTAWTEEAIGPGTNDTRAMGIGDADGDGDLDVAFGNRNAQDYLYLNGRTVPSVTTAAVTGVDSVSATSGGNVTSGGGQDVTARGICWGTEEDPTVADDTTHNGTGTGSFVSAMTGLSPGTTYHVRAYAVNDSGAAYGTDVAFTTDSTKATVTTAAVTAILATTATSGGEVTADGGAEVTARGVCWSTSENPTVADDTTWTGTGTGAFISTISGLSPGTAYHVRAYATNEVGTAYGDDVQFTTDTTATVTTAAVTEITHTTASCGGEVTADGGDSVTARGACWSTSENPTVADDTTFDGTGTGAFTSALTGLTAGTVYHVRAYATNAVGTAYGDDAQFTTDTTPTVTTAAVTEITDSSAASGGEVASDGGATVAARGVCWSTSENPTIADDTTFDGTGTGVFVSAITGLTVGTTYHVRAYATNAVGTGYGDDVSFTADSTIATVTTASVTEITDSSATCGGEVTADGGAEVTARGVCWSTSEDPTVADDTTFNGTGTGVFVSSITGLAPGMTVHVRAYAVNAIGTAYGDDVQFTSDSTIATVTTAAVTEISETTATCGGEVTADGGAEVTARGVCWSTSANPTVADDTTFNGAGIGAFVSAITGLSPGVTYHVRAYAANDVGTAYGDDVEFSADVALPEVTTAAITDRTPTTAQGGGEVTGDGGGTISARGVCYSTSENPTVGDTRTLDGTGTGAFSSDITGLVPDTRYYLRAYATNEAGTAYGAQLDFRTGGTVLLVTNTKGPFSTIQEAHDDEETTTGDTIQVEDAVHTEQGIGITKSVVIRGHGADQTIVQAHAEKGSATDQVFAIGGEAIATIQDMTIRHGVSSYAGGGIHNAADLTLVRCVIRDNEVHGETNAEGGGIRSHGGKIAIYDCTIADNSCPDGGGGMVLVDSALVYRCAITGNSAGFGGGVVCASEHQEFVNCTISGNSAQSVGGGFYVYYQSASLSNCTITENSCSSEYAGGIHRNSGTLTMKNSIVAGNTSIGPPDVEGTIVSGGYNMIGDNTGGAASFPAGLPNGNNDWVGTSAAPVDPLLLTLADNGGPTWTHALDDESPAIDKIPEGTNGMGTPPLDVDQRGEDRPARDAGDIGAFESQRGIPEVTTASVTEITATGARSGGTVTDDGSDPVTARGVCWSTSEEPTVEDDTTRNGTGIGSFTSLVTGLAPNTTYFLRAYATNGQGTGYGEARSFTTLRAYPVVTTADVSVSTPTTAECGGEVTSAGAYPVTARGVCWGLSENPTVAGSHTAVGSGTGAFTTTLTNLQPNTLYHVRAYAANEAGTSYGADKEFQTTISLPSVSTAEIASITSGAAEGGGEVTGEGGAPVTARGVCWSTSPGPTTEDDHTTNGSGLGSFTSSIAGLERATVYYVRAYAINMAGTGYGAELSFTTLPEPPAVLTTSVSSTGAGTADASGDVTDDGGGEVSARGICWSISPAPTTGDSHAENGTGTGAFAASITGLEPNTTYYVRAYATNEAGTSYGDALTLLTDVGVPTVVTSEVSSIEGESASCGGEVADDGGDDVTARGVCWSTSSGPTTGDAHTSDGGGLGAFTSGLTGLEPNTTYHVRAYATNGAGTGYGETRTFTTAAIAPTVLTAEVGSVGARGAECGGEVTEDGGAAVTARGVCWSVSPDPTTEDETSSDGDGLGFFTSSLTSLEPNTTYYARAYATNEVGTGYGEIRTFTTSIELPTVITAGMETVEARSAEGGGEVTDDGGDDVTARGVCWSTAHGPTTGDAHTSDGDGLGAFTSSLTGLEPNTAYYLRAYATNSAGTAYGDTVSFSTLVAAPVVTTGTVSSVTATTAECGGEVVDEGGGEVTACGVCWSTDPEPTVEGGLTAKSTGPFTASLTGLAPNTTYYVRAYATNEAGTSYGTEDSFTTLVAAPAVNTSDVTEITATGAECSGEVTDDGGGTVSARGICWSTSPNPSISGDRAEGKSGTGFFSCMLTGLSPNTAYYVRAYATNEAGTVYGLEKSFTTLIALPAVTTVEVSSIAAASALCEGEVTGAGGGSIAARGFCWSTSESPTIADDHTVGEGEVGAFGEAIGGLDPNTTYYVRAYATNEAGTTYGAALSFTTQIALASVRTNAVSDVAARSASCGGDVTDGGGDSVTVRGVCWSTDPAPTIEGGFTADGAGLGSFMSAITGLVPNTTYYVRAYATNGAGTVYGEELSFTTPVALATVVTGEVSSVTDSSATAAGQVAGAGGGAITACGICYGLAENPTVADDCAEATAGVGSFTIFLAGLEPNTAYHVRAYATNEAGTAYGEDVSFQTSEAPALSTVTTGAATMLGGSSLQITWDVVDDGGSPVIERGVCWSRSPNPTIENDYIVDGTGTGTFTCTIPDLDPNTVYYFRAFATNAAGTAYGNEVTFALWETELLKTGPNPFSETFAVSYALGASAPVNLDVYDIAGRRVRTLLNETVGSGMHTTEWDGRNDSGERVSSGVYYLRLVTPDRTSTQRVVLLR